MSSKFHTFQVRVDEWNGYGVSFDDGLSLRIAITVANEDGQIHCALGDLAQTKTLEPSDFFKDNAVHFNADISWAFSMVENAEIESLATALNVPFANREKLLSDLSTSISDNAKRLHDFVDSKALKAMSKSAVKTTSSLAFYTGNTERADFRRQAANSYPLLADILASNISTKVAIDRGKPLTDIVSKVLGGLSGNVVTKPVLRRIAIADELPEGSHIEPTIRLMTIVPPDWIPASGDEWRAFCIIATCLFQDLDCNDEDVIDVVRGCSGKWVELAKRVVSKSGIEESDTLVAFRYAMKNASDIVRSFADIVVLPLAAHSGIADTILVTPELRAEARSSAYKMLFKGRRAVEISELQRHWHHNSSHILGAARHLTEEVMSQLRNTIKEGEWPGLTDPVQCPNGLWVVPLTSANSLVEEGSALNHCVGRGGYTHTARTLGCYLLSIRDMAQNGAVKRLSTAEIIPQDPGSVDKISINQHLAHGNKSPSPAARDALSWYLSAIKHQRVHANTQLFAAYLNDQYIPDDGVERLCDYDWREPEILNTAIEPWGRYVVDPFRKYGLETLLECDEIKAVADLIAPELMTKLV